MKELTAIVILDSIKFFILEGFWYTKNEISYPFGVQIIIQSLKHPNAITTMLII